MQGDFYSYAVMIGWILFLGEFEAAVSPILNALRDTFSCFWRCFGDFFGLILCLWAFVKGFVAHFSSLGVILKIFCLFFVSERCIKSPLALFVSLGAFERLFGPFIKSECCFKEFLARFVTSDAVSKAACFFCVSKPFFIDSVAHFASLVVVPLHLSKILVHSA